MSGRTRFTIAVAAIAILALAGCGPTPDTAAQDATPAELTGDWKQTNSNSPDSYQEATITGDTITINWVSDNGDTTALYWAGSYEPPTEAGSFTWVSENDTSQTENALLASGDPTKEFAFDGTEISYEVSALGTTQTVKLAKQ